MSFIEYLSGDFDQCPSIQGFHDELPCADLLCRFFRDMLTIPCTQDYRNIMTDRDDAWLFVRT